MRLSARLFLCLMQTNQQIFDKQLRITYEHFSRWGLITDTDDEHRHVVKVSAVPKLMNPEPFYGGVVNSRQLFV